MLANYTQLAYHCVMKAVFVELPAFVRHRADYLDDEAFRKLQNLLLKAPEAGDLIPGTAGLRKLRFSDGRRGKGKRGGLQFWLFTLYGKDETSDLSEEQRKQLKRRVKAELDVRKR